MSASKHSLSKLRNVSRYLAGTLTYVALVLLSLVVIFPILNLLMASLKDSGELFTYPPRLLPRQPHWENYLTAWQSAPLGRFLLNSLMQSLLISLGQVATSVLAGYAFARMRFPGRNLLFGVVVATLVIPSEVTVIPNFFTIFRLGLLDTLAGLVVPFLATGFGIFLMRQFFLTIPQELLDAAQLDGAGHFRFLLAVALPLARPVAGALAVFAFLGAWNQYLWPLLITRSSELYTAQIGVAIFQNKEASTDWNVVAAAAMTVLGPTLLAFFFAQKQFLKGVSAGGLR